ncbi:hypothetical protein ACIBSW_18835 [Actinoplanes sp. NPDC049668]|uniref:hypothetical protein n=1 Tax=unclassified Actinoplanes TaxID=2626549 RepID=UPI0033A4F70D
MIQKSVFAALGVAAIVSAAFWYVRDSGEQSLDAALGAELATLVRPAVEEKMSMDSAPNGSGARRMACAVRPFGTDPVSVDAIAEVETVYVWALCETPATERSGVSLPIVVHLTPAVGIEVPTDADYDTGRAYDLFPERLHGFVDGGLPDGLEAVLEERIRELS